jgi:aspartate carbamoyltransferase catalytic subunit
MIQHLLGIEGKTSAELYTFLEAAESFVEVSRRDIKKVPALRGKTVVNLFFESSTRTLSSFDIAAKRLSADSVNLNVSSSSVSKGETLLDTVATLECMAPHILVMRHSESGAAAMIARRLSRTAVINAGDGLHEHPTQALLDLLTLKRHFHARKDGIEGLTVAVVGDVLHSRVARSNIFAHLALGNRIRLVGPPTLVPRHFEGVFGSGVSVHYDLREGLAGADVVLSLRMQFERQKDHYIPSTEEYSREYGITERLLASVCPQAVVLHPGPMNRGIEISSEVADGPRSLVRHQVENGVAVRMAVLLILAASVPVEETQIEDEE